MLRGEFFMVKNLLLPPPMGDGNTPEESEVQPKGPYVPCPCCGFLTIPNGGDALAYICPVCFWEIDLFIEGGSEASDQNHGLTLREAQKNFETYGAVLLRLKPYCRPAKPDESPKNR